MNQYTERFLDAMKVVSSKRQQPEKFDKTIRAQISAIPTEEDPYYIIEYDKLKYKVYTFYSDYIVGDVVYVRLVGGKMDGDKIIEGKVAPILQDRTITAMVELPKSKRWNLKLKDPNSEENDSDLNSKENEQMLTQSIGQNCLRIAGYFYAPAPEQGEAISFSEDLYGLEITLSNNKTYRFTCDQFMGNPYSGQKTFQTYDIYFDEPLKNGIYVSDLKIIKEGRYEPEDKQVIVEDITAQFLIIEDLSAQDWVMTYSTTTGYVQDTIETEIAIRPRLFYKGKEILELEENQKIEEEILQYDFNWKVIKNVKPYDEISYKDLKYSKTYIRYNFIEVINETENILASSEIIKIENKTISVPTYHIDQDNQYGSTTGLYLGSNFFLAPKNEGPAAAGAWGYGSLGNYNSFLPFSHIGNELPYKDYFSIISSYANAVILHYYPLTYIQEGDKQVVDENGQYYLLSKSYIPPTAEEQARQLTSSIHIFPKSVIVKYDADGILGSANKIYNIIPNAAFFPADHSEIDHLEWRYEVNDFILEDVDGNYARVNGYFVWKWEKNEGKWGAKGFEFIFNNNGNLKPPTAAKGGLFASFSQGADGQLNFTAINQYNGIYASQNVLNFVIVKANGDEISYEFEVEFLADGNLGTNGTKYALVIEDFWKDESKPWVSDDNWNGLYLRAQVFNTQTNEIIPNDVITWQWYNNGTELEGIETSYLDMSNSGLSINSADLNKVELVAIYDNIEIKSAYAFPYKNDNEITVERTANYFQYSTDGTSLIGGKTAYFKVYDTDVSGRFETSNVLPYADFIEKFIYYNKDDGKEILSGQDDLKDVDKIGKCLQLDFKTNTADLSKFLNNTYDYFHIMYYKNNKSIYNETCILNVNRFFSSLVNEWDGKVSVNDDSILTPLAVAGQKEDNAFSGVMLGAKKETETSPVKYGIFGYGKGQETFKLDSETGILHAYGAEIKGDITAYSLSLAPEVAGAAGLSTSLENGQKICKFLDERFEDEEEWKKYIFAYNANNAGIDTKVERVAGDGYNNTNSEWLIKITDEQACGGFGFGEGKIDTTTNDYISGVQASKNKRFLFIFTANIPIGYYLTLGTNNIGQDHGAEIKWLSTNRGVGNWQEYKLYVKCGTEADAIGSPNSTFGTTGYFFLSKDGVGQIAVLENGWFLSSATYYELLDGSLVDGGNLTGDFAGWQIKSDYLRYMQKNNSGTNYIHSFISPTIGSNTQYTVNNKAPTTNYGWALYFGGNNSGNGNFGVDQNGKLYATGADISGSIHAGGNSTIGNWTVTETDNKRGTEISSTRIQNGTYWYQTVIKSPATNTIDQGGYNGVFGVRAYGSETGNDFKHCTFLVRQNGQLEIGNGKFKVDPDGNMTASGVDLIGKITATSGILKNGITIGSDENAIITSGSNVWGDQGLVLQTGPKGAYSSTGLENNLIGINSAGYCRIHAKYIRLASYPTHSTSETQIAALLLHQSGGQLEGTWYDSSSQGITSDITKKNTVSSIDSSYSILFDNLHPVTYKYNDGTSDRLHTGFIAQEVKEALDKADLSTQEFAGLIIQKKGTEDESWYLRYDEFIALNTWQIQKAKIRISELETRVSQLENLLQANSN